MAQILRGFGPADVDPHARVLVEAADVGDAELGERVDDQPLDAHTWSAAPSELATLTIG